MEKNGFHVEAEDFQNKAAVEARNEVPPELQSCHTAIVDGYIIEGHVPVEEIRRLLVERPDIVGLAVAGMPLGAPGMGDAGVESQPFDVIAFDRDGQTHIYASYP